MAALLIVFLLALLAFRLPIGVVISLRLWPGFPPFTIRESIPLLGARLTIAETLKPILAVLYLSFAIWFAGGVALNIKPLFYSLGLVLLGLLTATLSINPMTYAPFFLEIAAIVCVPLISPPGKKVGGSVRRFLTFQSLGMLLILLGTGLILSFTTQPEVPNLPLIPVIILGLGFALIIGIPPFHSWILLILGENPIYESSLICFVIPVVSTIILIKSITLASLLPFSSYFFQIMQTIALFTILFGGIWSAFATHAGRALGYAIIQKIGFSFLIISMIEFSTSTSPDTTIFILHVLALGLVIWTYSLSMNVFFEKTADLSFASLQGLAYRLPVASIGALTSIFSFTGIPLLAFFPIYSLILPQLINKTTAPIIIGVVGSILLAIFGIRLLHVFFNSPIERTWQLDERRIQIFLLAGGLMIIIIMGIFPNIYLPYFVNWARTISGTAP
jgi:NADH:ubiquinone oxidoreductase subunit 2 (subunit N)